ncbi:PAX3- and PAX7-binding protein 1 isoform X2 [Chrysoperla carnea]|nr:PAX3- and PAX7-binding protein 1 isoform X2 [Chrysoperla carnea]
MVVKSEKEVILNGRAALVAGKDDVSSDEDDSRGRHRFSHPDNVKIIVESGMIPDAAMIHAARKRRQRAREMGGDYVPLEERKEKKDKGRLIREEDGDGDDGSDEERIDMTINTQAQDIEKRREQFKAAQEDSDRESDRETEEWENQQIRKGVTGAQITSVQNETLYGVSYYTGFSEESVENNLYNSSTNAMVKTDSNDQKTPESIANKLRERVQQLKENYTNHDTKLKQITDELETCQRDLIDLERKAPECAKRFRFYQELRGYVTDLVECLDEKIPMVSNLEQRWMEVIGKRANTLAERRRQDVRDQAEEITSQSRLNSRPRPTGGPEEEARVRRAAEREGRRNRRRRTREQAAQLQITPKHLEGMSSDDEFPEQDNILYKQQKDQVLESVEQVFSDVIEDFSSLSSILERFESWRQTDFTAYSEAYASLVLPKIVGPILRLQILSWDPFNSNCSDLEQYHWMKTLMTYGLTSSETEETLRADPDINLVPAIVDKIIILKLKDLVEQTWDPMSSSQSLRLVGLIGRFVRRYPTLGPGSQRLQDLFTAIVDKIQQAVEHDVFIPIFPKQVLETKSSFFQRQFNSAVKLLGNITCWQGTLADHVLKDLAINSLLNRYLLSGLRVCQLIDAVSKAQLIINALPRIWLQSDVKEDLRMFIMCITQFSGQLNSDNPLHLESLEILSSIKNTLHI